MTRAIPQFVYGSSASADRAGYHVLGRSPSCTEEMARAAQAWLERLGEYAPALADRDVVVSAPLSEGHLVARAWFDGRDRHGRVGTQLSRGIVLSREEWLARGAEPFQVAAHLDRPDPATETLPDLRLSAAQGAAKPIITESDRRVLAALRARGWSTPLVLPATVDGERWLSQLIGLLPPLERADLKVATWCNLYIAPTRCPFDLALDPQRTIAELETELSAVKGVEVWMARLIDAAERPVEATGSIHDVGRGEDGLRTTGEGDAGERGGAGDAAAEEDDRTVELEDRKAEESAPATDIPAESVHATVEWPSDPLPPQGAAGAIGLRSARPIMLRRGVRLAVGAATAVLLVGAVTGWSLYRAHVATNVCITVTDPQEAYRCYQEVVAKHWPALWTGAVESARAWAALDSTARLQEMAAIDARDCGALSKAIKGFVVAHPGEHSEIRPQEIREAECHELRDLSDGLKQSPTDIRGNLRLVSQALETGRIQKKEAELQTLQRALQKHQACLDRCAGLTGLTGRSRLVRAIEVCSGVAENDLLAAVCRDFQAQVNRLNRPWTVEVESRGLLGLPSRPIALSVQVAERPPKRVQLGANAASFQLIDADSGIRIVALHTTGPETPVAEVAAGPLGILDLANAAGPDVRLRIPDLQAPEFPNGPCPPANVVLRFVFAASEENR